MHEAELCFLLLLLWWWFCFYFFSFLFFPRRYLKVFKALERTAELWLLWKCQTWWRLVTTTTLNSQQALSTVTADFPRKQNAGCHIQAIITLCFCSDSRSHVLSHIKIQCMLNKDLLLYVDGARSGHRLYVLEVYCLGQKGLFPPEPLTINYPYATDRTFYRH